jgi:single-stranded-DNA-specific exonuclease
LNRNTPQSKRWLVAPPISPEVALELSDYPAIIQQVLYNRGVDTASAAEVYMTAGGSAHDPLLLSGMRETVERLWWSIDQREPIAVYGDYDVDGVTATALMVELLERLGANVRWHIPNRFEEGYGLNNEALDKLHEGGVELVLTVDCGIRSIYEAEHARELGMDLIISDHHHPGSEIPVAAAVVCPKQAGDVYPDKDLSGVGLAYKIAQGLLQRRAMPGCQADDWLDLVALGTISDVVPLRGENRGLVRQGLTRLRASRRQGVLSLAGAAAVKLPSLSAMDVGFMLGPRLNAAGRLESAEAALRLLMSRDVHEAGLLAQELDTQNRKRQDLTREIQEKAIAMAADSVETGFEEIIFAFDEGFNSGVVGLAASRLVETFYRPAIVGQIEGETTRASCRSIPEFHITRALDECKELLVRHGGHQVAAGFTVLNENLPALKEKLGAIARRELGEQVLVPTLHADAEVTLDELRMDLLPYLDQLQPTGQENPEATFVSRGLKVLNCRPVGKESQHLKITLVDDENVRWDAIAFRQAHQAERLMTARGVDLFYTFERNVYNDRVTLQLNVKDIKPVD